MNELTILDKMEERDEYRISYHGALIYPRQYYIHEPCSYCGYQVWHKHLIQGICPLCVLRQEYLYIAISFGHSKSKNYPKNPDEGDASRPLLGHR